MMASAPLKSGKRVVKAYSLDPEVVAAVEALAKAQNRTVSNMVEKLLKASVTNP